MKSPLNSARLQAKPLLHQSEAIKIFIFCGSSTSPQYKSILNRRREASRGQSGATKTSLQYFTTSRHPAHSQRELGRLLALPSVVRFHPLPNLHRAPLKTCGVNPSRGRSKRRTVPHMRPAENPEVALNMAQRQAALGASPEVKGQTQPDSLGVRAPS